MLKIKGRRVSIRDWVLEDLPIVEGWMQPEHEWHKYDGPYYPQETSAEVKQRLARRKTSIETGEVQNPRRSLIIADITTDTVLGTVSWYWLGEETNWLAVGLSIYDPANWNKGLGYEALGLWSDYLLQANPALVRLDVQTWSGNKGMMRLAEKLGYQQEARFRKARIVNGEHYDGMGYGILREEWNRLYSGGFAARLQEPEK